MSRHYEVPKRDCNTCTGNTFPNGCAQYCDLFKSEEEEDQFEAMLAMIPESHRDEWREIWTEEAYERALREAEARAEDGPQPPL